MRIDQMCLAQTKAQFELDYNMQESTQISEHVFLAPVKVREGARLFENTDPFLKIGILLGNAYVMADENLHAWLKKELFQAPPEWWCAFWRLRGLDAQLHQFGREISDTHIYFLPSQQERVAREEFFSWYHDQELEQFRGHNDIKYSLCFLPSQPDRMAVAAENEAGEVMGMSGASEDGKYLWQVGIDVAPNCQGQGLAVRLVNQMTDEILRIGKTPYYGTAESHAISRNVAIACGYLPAWSEIVVKKTIPKC